MKRTTWVIVGCLVLLTTGCTQKENGDSSSKVNEPIAKQTEVVVTTKQTAITHEKDAIALVWKKIKTDKLYEWRKYDECLAFVTEDTTDANYDIGVHENHVGRCGGDPITFPIVDRFRVNRTTGNLMWYNFIDDEYVDYSQMKKVMQEIAEEQAKQKTALPKSE